MTDKIDKTLDFHNPASPYKCFAHEIADALLLETTPETINADVRRELEKRGFFEETLTITAADEAVLSRLWEKANKLPAADCGTGS